MPEHFEGRLCDTCKFCSNIGTTTKKYLLCKNDEVGEVGNYLTVNTTFGCNRYEVLVGIHLATKTCSTCMYWVNEECKLLPYELWDCYNDEPSWDAYIATEPTFGCSKWETKGD